MMDRPSLVEMALRFVDDRFLAKAHNHRQSG